MTTLQFNEQVVDYSGSLKPFAYKLTRNSEDASDLIQETVYKALINADKFHKGTNLKAWLFTIMRNIFINNYRRNSRHGIVSDPTENLSLLNSIRNSTTNSGLVNIHMEEVNKALENLSEEFRIPFLLHYEGFKYNEIAEELQLPLGTVKSRIFFARKALQKMIDRLV